MELKNFNLFVDRLNAVNSALTDVVHNLFDIDKMSIHEYRGFITRITDINHSLLSIESVLRTVLVTYNGVVLNNKENK